MALAGLVSVPALAGIANAQDALEPVPEAPPLARAERKVLVGADLGYALLTARGSSRVSYEPSFTWGGHARIELRTWLGLRLSARHGLHAVDLAPGALSTPDAAVLDGVALDHPPLDLWLIGARLEPTWVATPRMRLWAGPGVGWARIEAGELEASIDDCAAHCELATANRSASAVELSGALGGTYDVVPHWVAASLSISGGGFVGRPTGTLFDAEQPMQAFVGGSMLHVAALPELGGSFSMLLSVDVVF